MYQFLVDFMSANQVIMIGMLVAFVLTFLCLRFPFSFTQSAWQAERGTALS